MVITRSRCADAPHSAALWRGRLAMIVLTVIGAAAVAVFAHPLHAQQAALRTVWDGVYTLDQAKRGALKSGLCTSCHGDGFEGGSAPQLTGADFMGRWEGRTVADLFDLVRLTMPDDDPGSLPREQYADLIAYILAVNKLPTGMTEIGTAIEPLKEIQIVAKKP